MNTLIKRLMILLSIGSNLATAQKPFKIETDAKGQKTIYWKETKINENPFQEIAEYGDGLFGVRDFGSTEWYFIDTTGKIAFDKKFNHFPNQPNAKFKYVFVNGRALVNLGEKELVFIDKKGNALCKTYPVLHPFDDGVTFASDDTGGYLLDNNFKEIAQYAPGFSFVGRFSIKGLSFLSTTKKDKTILTVIDKKGKIALDQSDDFYESDFDTLVNGYLLVADKIIRENKVIFKGIESKLKFVSGTLLYNKNIVIKLNGMEIKKLDKYFDIQYGLPGYFLAQENVVNYRGENYIIIDTNLNVQKVDFKGYTDLRPVANCHFMNVFDDIKKNRIIFNTNWKKIYSYPFTYNKQREYFHQAFIPDPTKSTLIIREDTMVRLLKTDGRVWPAKEDGYLRYESHLFNTATPGLAPYVKNGSTKIGIADPITEKLIIEPVFEKVKFLFPMLDHFLARKSKDEPFTLYNEKGEVVLENIEEVFSYSSKRNIILKGKEMYYLVTSGKGLVNQGPECIELPDGNYILLSDNIYQVLDCNFNIILKDPQFNLNYIFGSKNVAFAFIEGGKVGLKNIKGNIVVSAQYDEILTACKDFLYVKKDDLYGMISTDGRIIREPIYKLELNKKGVPTLADENYFYSLADNCQVGLGSPKDKLDNPISYCVIFFVGGTSMTITGGVSSSQSAVLVQIDCYKSGVTDQDVLARAKEVLYQHINMKNYSILETTFDKNNCMEIKKSLDKSNIRVDDFRVITEYILP